MFQSKKKCVCVADGGWIGWIGWFAKFGPLAEIVFQRSLLFENMCVAEAGWLVELNT